MRSDKENMRLRLEESQSTLAERESELARLRSVVSALRREHQEPAAAPIGREAVATWHRLVR